MSSQIQYEKYEFQCSTLTPVHIGSGELLRKNIDYFCAGEKIGKADPRKILRIIGEDKIQWWTAKIENNESIWEDLKNHHQLEDVTYEQIPITKNAGSLTNKSFLREHIRNQLTLNPLLPGSSIKGALRTALLAQPLVNRFRSKGYKLLSDEYTIYRNRKKFFKNFFVVEKDLVNLKAPPSGIEFSGQQNDIFKFLQVPDVELDKSSLRADLILTLNLDRNNEWKLDDRYTIPVENVNPDHFDLTIRIHPWFFSQNQHSWQNIHDLLNAINNHTRHLLKKEKNDYKKDLENNLLDPKIGKPLINSIDAILSEFDQQMQDYAIFRVGFAIGWDFMTGAWFKDSQVSNNATWEEFVKILRDSNRKTYPPGIPFPKTRRITSDYRLPGFLKIKLK